MREQGLTQANVITSDYHVARALELCEPEGISATGIACSTALAYLPKNYCREALILLCDQRVGILLFPPPQAGETTELHFDILIEE